MRGQLEVLYSKQARVNQFRTRAERDAYLNNELVSLRSYQATQNSNLENAQNAVEDMRKKIHDIASRTTGMQAQLEERREKMKTLSEEYATMKEQHSQLIEKRKELWREDARLTTTLGHAENESRSAERALASMMDKDTGSGLRAVDRIKERYNLTGVYGPLYRLFELPDRKYSTAVELTAGNRYGLLSFML